jgi:hypothetical protein
MHSRCGTVGSIRENACLGLPDVFASERGQGNHTPSPGASTSMEKSSVGPVQWCRECEPVIRNRTQGRASMRGLGIRVWLGVLVG